MGTGAVVREDAEADLLDEQRTRRGTGGEGHLQASVGARAALHHPGGVVRLFDEPNWESGKNDWWRFRRADGQLWGLAGLWNTWTDKTTGEIVESYTMLTLNADDHPLMRRMHKPDPKSGPDQQDKRSVVPIELVDLDTWLGGTNEEASKLLRLAPVKTFEAGPA